MRPLLALGVALLLTAGPAVAAQPRASLPDIEDEVMCPICGTPLELSESPQAERERELIRRLIAQGRDKDEIKDALVAEYGEEVLAVPQGEGFDLSAWLVPALAILLGVGGIALAFARFRREERRDPLPAKDLDPADAAQLERDISSYDV